jgi:preprotein translocase subunit SecE
MSDKPKIALALLVSGGALAAFYYFQDHSLLLRVGGLLVALGMVTAIMFQTVLGRNTWAFVQESHVEVRKVVWPTRKETVNTTLLVVAISVIMAIFLWLLDFILIWAVKHLTGQGA